MVPPPPTPPPEEAAGGAERKEAERRRQAENRGAGSGRKGYAEGNAAKKRALQISLVAIASVFVFEFIAGIYTNSLALITDSTHALLDTVVTAILIIAVTLALKPRDTDHTYGHGKIETIGGFMGGVSLFVVAVFFIYEATVRIAAASASGVSVVNPGAIGFAAVIYTLAVDGFRIAVLGRASKKGGGASTLKADLYHALADLGSTAVALAGLWLVTAGFYQGDSLAAIVLGAFLAYLSSRVAYHNAMELTDVISPKLVARVRQAARNTEGVLECSDVKMRRVGREVFVEVTISLQSDISFERAHETSAQVERNIASSLADSGLAEAVRLDPSITVHFEPTAAPGEKEGKDLPAELAIEKAVVRVSGVRGVHNVLVSQIGTTGSVEVSLHVQVNRSATLDQAHAIANAVEDAIREQLREAENITVHLEPLMPEIAGVEPVTDSWLEESVRQIILEAGGDDIKNVGKVAAYYYYSKTPSSVARGGEDSGSNVKGNSSGESNRSSSGGGSGNILKIDASCTFNTDRNRNMSIEETHERVSEIEKQIRARYPGSIVTIHAEPASSYTGGSGRNN